MKKGKDLDAFDDTKGSVRWYVVNSEPQKERQALASLRGEGFRAYLPMRAVQKKTAIHAAPLFPRYLFVQLNLEDETWWRVFTAQGVASVITQANALGRPTPVPTPRCTISMIRRKEVDGIIILTKSVTAPVKRGPAPFEPGMKVRITRGGFMGCDAIFQHGDAMRIAVLLSILGDDRVVELSTADAMASAALNAS